jgi:hypothetical protein
MNFAFKFSLNLIENKKHNFHFEFFENLAKIPNWDSYTLLGIPIPL